MSRTRGWKESSLFVNFHITDHLLKSSAYGDLSGSTGYGVVACFKLQVLSNVESSVISKNVIHRAGSSQAGGQGVAIHHKRAPQMHDNGRSLAVVGVAVLPVRRKNESPCTSTTTRLLTCSRHEVQLLVAVLLHRGMETAREVTLIPASESCHQPGPRQHSMHRHAGGGTGVRLLPWDDRQRSLDLQVRPTLPPGDTFLQKLPILQGFHFPEHES